MRRIQAVGLSGVLITVSLLASGRCAEKTADPLDHLDLERGVVALINLPPAGADRVVQRVAATKLLLYFQSADMSQVEQLQQAAERAGLLGTRIFADTGGRGSIHLATDLADRVVVVPKTGQELGDEEIVRVLHPLGTAWVGQRKLTKPVPKGADQWTHPYHGPDNNTQSTDQLAKGELRTQYLGYPLFSPMPEQTVICGGRMFKAMGHIAHKANQDPMLNKLLCINAYNGTILWQRDLPEGFMIHRNTMIATDDALLMGDDTSCKVIDGVTGKVRSEITVPAGLGDGPVWKWMALRDGVLYAMVGHEEVHVDTQPSDRRGLGHWPWGMWKGHDYRDPKTSFGFGRTLLAIDLSSRKVLWHYSDQDYLDGRAVVMNDNFIFCYSPERFLACIDIRDGHLAWKNSDADLLKAIGPNGPAQHYITGYATSCYMKCNDKYIFFAGPQRKMLVAARARDGSLAWTYPVGNVQLVLRDDAVYAAGPQQEYGVRLDYDSGRVLSRLLGRRACTRATGTVDSVFYRANGGTVRLMTESGATHHVAPMRPPCQDGVLIAGGHFYWGPWMCGCQLSLYGNISTAPEAMKHVASLELGDARREVSGEFTKVSPLGAAPNDWTCYRGDNGRSDTTDVGLADQVRPDWSVNVCAADMPTAPVAAGDLVFVADRTGCVQARDMAGTLVWKTRLSGAVFYPPAIAQDRLFVGSADGRVVALEARTGRRLWSYHVAPRSRWISVYGKLMSTWPVAGGVVVQDGIVYAAAGIAHYDGTYVVALDAVTGKVKARNDSAGTLSTAADSGISLQGNLMIQGGELRFLGGNVYEWARFDLGTLRCLNTPHNQANSQFRTAFYPYYPTYGKYVSLDHTMPDGSWLYHDASYEGAMFNNLTLQMPLPAGKRRPYKQAARWPIRPQRAASPIRWKDLKNRRFTGLIVCAEKRILAAGHRDGMPQSCFLAAIDITSGKDVWRKKLPALPVKGGVAIDSKGRIFVALENGQLLCFSGT